MIVSQNWFIKFASLHFAKVLIARTARTFGKVYEPDYQSLLGSVVYGRFANAPKNKILTCNYIRIIIRAIRVSHTQLRQLARFVRD